MENKTKNSQMMKNLEEVTANETHRTRKLLNQVEIFTGGSPSSRTRPFKDEWVLQVSLS